MTTVMSDRLSGTIGNSFVADGVYTNFSGTAPKYVTDARYGNGLQFAAATASQIAEAFSGTGTLRTFDRVYLISATPTASSAVVDVRDGSAVAICKAVIDNVGKLHLQNSAGADLAGGVSAATVPIGSRFRISYTMNGTAWTAVIFSNDTDGTVQQTLTPTGTITSTTAASIREGFITAGGFGAAITFNTYWPQDSDTSSGTGVRSLWTPEQQRGRASVRPPTQTRARIVAVAPISERPPTSRPLLRRPVLRVRPRIAVVPPTQIALPPVYVAQQSSRKVRATVLRRSRVAPVMAPRDVPLWQESPRRSRIVPRIRSRVSNVVPTQIVVPPVYVVQEPSRKTRFLLRARSRVSVVTPAQIVAAPPVYVPQQGSRKVRATFPRRAHVAPVVSAQDAPVTQESRRPKFAPRVRSRVAVVPPGQIVAAAPVYVPQQGSRKVRAAFPRRSRVTPVPAAQATPVPNVPKVRRLPRRLVSRVAVVPPQQIILPPFMAPRRPLPRRAVTPRRGRIVNVFGSLLGQRGSITERQNVKAQIVERQKTNAAVTERQIGGPGVTERQKLGSQVVARIKQAAQIIERRLP